VTTLCDKVSGLVNVLEELTVSCWPSCVKCFFKDGGSKLTVLYRRTVLRRLRGFVLDSDFSSLVIKNWMCQNWKHNERIDIGI